MSRLKKLNKLNKTKTLSVAMSVGLVAANLVNAVPVMAVAPVSAHAMSTRTTIDPAKTQSFDKKNPEDISATVTVSNDEYQLQAVKNGRNTLEEGTDYTFDGSEITISQDYLMNLKVGTASLKLDFDKGTDPIMRISVKDSRATAKLSTKTVDAKHLRNITATLTLHDDTFAGIEGLQEDSDYTVKGSRVTISKDYLATLADGPNTLVFNFDESPAVELTFTVKNSEVAPSAKLQSVSAENGTLTATFDQDLTDTPTAADFTVKKDGVAVALTDADVTVNGDKASIKVDEVAATDADQTIVYGVTYKGVTKNATLVVPAKTDNTAPVITLTGDATVTVANGATYTELGATATDDVDATVNVTSVIKNSAGTVVSAIDTTVADTYTITYSAKDAAGNAAADVTRTVVVQPAAVVSSVSVINATTVEVVLAAKPATDLTVADASKFAVTVNGTAVAAPTAVTKLASDLTGKTYRLTIATLNGQQGDISVNGTAAAVPTGKAYAFDYKDPEVLGIVAKGTNIIEVTFSEKMDSATIIPANIDVTKDGTPLGGVAWSSVSKAVLDSTGTKATLTLAANLTVADYKVVFGVNTPAQLSKDVAGNAVYGGTEVSFRPTSDQLQTKAAPALTNALYNNGTGKLTLTFDKAITDSLLDVTKLSVNGVALTATDVDVDTTGNDNVVVLQLGSASKTAVNALTGALTLTSQADAYGATISATNVKTTGETIAIVKEAPAILSSVAYNQETNLLTLGFDQAVKLDNANVAKVGISDAQSVQVTRTMAVDATGTVITDFTTANTTWTFDLSKAANVAGTLEGYNPTSTTLKAFLAANAVKNAANVYNIDNQDIYSEGVLGTYTADAAKPTIASAEYNNLTKELKLTFSEKINGTVGSFDEDKIAIYSDATTTGTLVDDLNLGLVEVVQAKDVKEAAGSTTTLTFVLKDNTGVGGNDLSAIATNIEAAFAAGNSMKVVLGASAVTDEASKGNDATTYATGLAITYNDYVKPTATGPVSNAAAVNASHVVVNFSEKVDKATAETIANYVIKDAQLNVLAITSAKLQANGTDVLLTTAAQTAGKPYVLAVSNVKDLQNNVMDAWTGGSFLGSSTSATATFKLSSAVFATVANALNDTITLTFSSDVDPTTATNIANYSVLKHADADAAGVYTNATAVSLTGATAKMVSGDSKKVEITLHNDLTNTKDYRVIAANVTDIYGNALSTANAEGEFYASATATGDVTIAAPTVKEFKVAGSANDYATLTFAEELDPTTVIKNNFTLDVDGDTVSDVLNAQYAWDATTGKATVTLTTNKDFTTAKAVTINGVSDIAGNALTATTVLASSVVMSDAVKPTVSKVEMFVPTGTANDVLVITFNDSDILAASAQNPDNYVITANGVTIPIKGTGTNNYLNGDGTPVLVTATDGVNNAVTFTFDNAEFNLLRSGTYTVAISNVMDQSGNKIDTVTKNVTAATATEYGITVDTTKPTINATTGIGSFNAISKSIGLTFSENVDKTSAENIANYKIEYSAAGTFADTVTLTPILATHNGTTGVTLNYAESVVKAGSSKLRVTVANVMDAAGNVIDPASAQSTYTAAAQPAVTAMTLNTQTGVTDSANTQEYSIDGGATWTALGNNTTIAPTVLAQLSATNDVLVRTKETGAAPAGVIQTINLTASTAITLGTGTYTQSTDVLVAGDGNLANGVYLWRAETAANTWSAWELVTLAGGTPWTVGATKPGAGLKVELKAITSASSAPSALVQITSAD